MGPTAKTSQKRALGERSRGSRAHAQAKKQGKTAKTSAATAAIVHGGRRSRQQQRGPFFFGQAEHVAADEPGHDGRGEIPFARARDGRASKKTGWIAKFLGDDGGRICYEWAGQVGVFKPERSARTADPVPRWQECRWQADDVREGTAAGAPENRCAIAAGKEAGVLAQPDAKTTKEKAYDDGVKGDRRGGDTWGKTPTNAA